MEFPADDYKILAITASVFGLLGYAVLPWIFYHPDNSVFDLAFPTASATFLLWRTDPDAPATCSACDRHDRLIFGSSACIGHENSQAKRTFGASAAFEHIDDHGNSGTALPGEPGRILWQSSDPQATFPIDARGDVLPAVGDSNGSPQVSCSSS